VFLKNQSRFLFGRQIADNVVIAKEVIHAMKILNSKEISMVLKLDVENTFERLE
jgi:hypothetical protein